MTKAQVCDCGNPAGHTGAVVHPEGLKSGSLAKAGVGAHLKPKAVTFEAVVIRCGCPDEETRRLLHPRDIYGALGPCPQPKKVENHGIVAAYYRNPIKRLLWALAQLIKNKKGRIYWQP